LIDPGRSADVSDEIPDARILPLRGLRAPGCGGERRARRAALITLCALAHSERSSAASGLRRIEQTGHFVHSALISVWNAFLRPSAGARIHLSPSLVASSSSALAIGVPPA